MDAPTENPIPAKKPLPLPIGNSDWAAVKGGYWSADKTQLISGLLDRKALLTAYGLRLLRGLAKFLRRDRRERNPPHP